MDVRNFRFERVLLEGTSRECNPDTLHDPALQNQSTIASPFSDLFLRLQMQIPHQPFSASKRLRSPYRSPAAFSPPTQLPRATFLTPKPWNIRTSRYMWLAAWLSPSSPDTLPQGDVKINVICPATDVHIRKARCALSSTMLHETPEIYQSIVVPYIASIPPERTNWVHEILSGQKEQSKILYTSPSFIILPDMKWDLHTLSSLYLVAISRDAAIKSLRDLRTHHIPLLKSIRREAGKVCKERWGLNTVDLRMFIHYHPSYYHFHVHIVNSAYEGGGGMRVGQAHLVDDVISLLELDVGNTPSLFERRTLVYGLGEQHGLYEAINAAQLMEQQH
ncbi:Scavenger mRNA decapping enzyme [Mycena kentingensis (nom. inval.)]|nr:Scavenger mRNA decapping enzyme [Mycena kentingensis (nom. inval.)]